MSYSITPILHSRVDQKGLQKIIIQVIYKRKKIYADTSYKVRKDQWSSSVINHANKTKINDALKKRMDGIESRLIDVIESNGTMEQVVQAVKENISETKAPAVYDYIYDLAERLTGKLSTGTLKHYKSTANKIEEFAPGVKFSSIDTKWMEDFEAYLRKPHVVKVQEKEKIVTLDSNTINAIAKRLKGIFVKAKKDKFIKADAFIDYKVPKYNQKIVEYLEEDEIESFAKITEAIQLASMKLAGYYFLLSCFTGYRIGDAKRFDYDKMVKGNNIILRTSKNKKIVSIHIHKRLKPVLDFVKDHPFKLSEENARGYVRDISKLAGITKHVKFHSGRHSFAMLLMVNGFTIDEVAELIGDSELIAKVYAKIHNETLNKKIKDRLG